MCGAVGKPTIPDTTERTENGHAMHVSEHDDSSVLEYQDLFVWEADQEYSVHFDEKYQLPVTSSGYPLKERDLQLLCDSKLVSLSITGT